MSRVVLVPPLIIWLLCIRAGGEEDYKMSQLSHLNAFVGNKNLNAKITFIRKVCHLTIKTEKSLNGQTGTGQMFEHDILMGRYWCQKIYWM